MTRGSSLSPRNDVGPLLVRTGNVRTEQRQGLVSPATRPSGRCLAPTDKESVVAQSSGGVQWERLG
jgi:hypothetical protein